MQRTVGPFSGDVVPPVRAGTPDRPGPSPKAVRGSGWRRTSHGYYVPAEVRRTPEQRIAEAAVLVPARGAITGWAALRWQGGRWFDGTVGGGAVETPVTVVSPASDIRTQPGIRVLKAPVGPGGAVTHDGLRVCSPAVSAVHDMRHAPSLVEAVVVADMAAYSDLASVLELRRCLDAQPRHVGNPLAWRAVALAHENSWSPMETRLRLLWLLTAGLPPPLVNAPVFDLAGRHLGTPDLLDVEAGLAIEYDGAEHHGGVRRLRDNAREDALRDAGLSYLTVLGGELRHQPRLVARLHRARCRAATQIGHRSWTTELPSWWRPADTVERRRALRRRNRP